MTAEFDIAKFFALPDPWRVSRKARDIVGFRPPPEIEKAVEQAVQATGAGITEIMVRCIRRSLVAVVQEILSERQRAAGELAELTMREEFKSSATHEPKPKHKRKPD